MHLFAGVDDGHADIKVAFRSARGLVFTRIPATGIPGRHQSISVANRAAAKDSFVYLTADGPYTVGRVQNHAPTNTPDYPTSTLNLVLIAHAIRQLDIGGSDSLSICTGLPLKRFFSQGGENTALISAKRDHLLNSKWPEAEDGTKICRPKSHTVFSEGVAAWLDSVTRFDGNKVIYDKEALSAPTAFIDIGGETTDIGVMQNWAVENGSATTIRFGMLEVYRQLKDALAERFGGEAPSDLAVRAAVTSGKLERWGEEHDVSSLVRESINTVVQSIRAEALRRLGTGSNVKRVMFVGGGAAAMKGYIKEWFRNEYFPDQPEFANARGMLKASILLSA